MSALIIIIVAFLFSALCAGVSLWLAFRNPPSARWDDDEHNTYKEYPTRENYRNRPWH